MMLSIPSLGRVRLVARIAAFLVLVPLLASAAKPAPDSGTVTGSNLVGLEPFWPYRVTLVEAWQPDGREKPLGAGTPGILIRVEPSGLARIDFGSGGKYDVPVGKTDLVELANRIRRGELAKAAPNFTLAMRMKLVDSDRAELTSLSPEAMADRPGFLCVFADPAASGFEALAAALAPLRDRHGVMTILFPQSAQKDARVLARLRALGWHAHFVYDFLSEAYTGTLLAPGTAIPAIVLQTNEGRVVFEGAASPEIVPALAASIDRAFGGAPASASASSPLTESTP